MSDLWKIDVLNRGERWIDLRVRQRHPDAGSMPESKQFVLNLLLDEAYGYDEKFQRRATCPLGEEFPVDNFWDADLADERADEFIESVRIYRQVNAPFHEKEAHAAVDEKVLAKGIARDSEDWEPAWIEAWNAWWKAPDGPPIAIHRVVVADPRWIQHLHPGQSFESASYAVRGEWISENRDEKPELPADAQVKAALADFPLSQVPRGERAMNPELIALLATAGSPLAQDALQSAVQAHQRFLASGGRGGSWELLSVAGMPLCIYTGASATEGEQLALRHKMIASGTSLAEQELSHSDLSGCIGRGVVFRSAKLDGCAMTDAFFDGADFSGASLQKTDFSGSSLQRCSFRGADLRGADFEHTDCSGADFTDAQLEGSRFPGALLDGIQR